MIEQVCMDCKYVKYRLDGDKFRRVCTNEQSPLFCKNVRRSDTCAKWEVKEISFSPPNCGSAVRPAPTAPLAVYISIDIAHCADSTAEIPVRISVPKETT